MSQKKAKLINKILEQKNLEDMGYKSGDYVCSIKKDTKRFYQACNWIEKTRFSRSLKEELNETTH